MKKMSIPEIILNLLRNKFVKFSGRAGRKEVWAWLIFQVALGVLFPIISALFISMGSFEVYALLQIIFGVIYMVLMVPGIALIVRRAHDVEHSGWFCILLLVLPTILASALIGLTQDILLSMAVGILPALYWFYLIYFKKGTAGPNKYGEEASYIK